MKHPLTSKERRGLLAVAAAALLCMSSAFIFRNCSSFSYQGGAANNAEKKAIEYKSGKETKIEKDSVVSAKAAKKEKEVKRKSKKKKAPKSYPLRDPLSEPCD